MQKILRNLFFFKLLDLISKFSKVTDLRSIYNIQSYFSILAMKNWNMKFLRIVTVLVC